MSIYESKYEYRRLWGNPYHLYSCVGAIGAVHLHITDHGDEHAEKYGERYSGGIEGHWRYAIANRPPDHALCPFLNAPCWHDGSSLQATETWIPLWRACQGDPDAMFDRLENAATEILEGRQLFLGQLMELVTGCET